MQVDFLSRCLILLNGKVSRWSIFGVQVSENGTRPSRFLADCNGVAADRNKSSRISGIVPGVGRRYAYGRRISLPFGIHIDRLSPMLRLARAVEGINSCLVAKYLPALRLVPDIPGYRRLTGGSISSGCQSTTTLLQRRLPDIRADVAD